MAATIEAQSGIKAHLHPSDEASTPALLTFEPFDLPSSNQRTLGAPHPPNTVSPLALRPSPGADQTEPSLAAAIAAVQNLQLTSHLTSLLSRHGALLFRGLPIHTAADFSAFAHAFGFAPYQILGANVERRVLAPNISPANEAPKGVLIFNHNELAQTPASPGYIFFCGQRVPAPGLRRGGETPVSSSLELFARAQREIPAFVRQLAQKGVLSTIVYKPARQYPGGSTLQQAFGEHFAAADDAATRRAKVEAQIRRYARGEHTSWEWSVGDDGEEEVLTLTHRLPVIRTQPGTGLPMMFTGLVATWRDAQHNRSAAHKAAVGYRFGDGSLIPEEYLRKLAEITDEIRVLHEWHEGDVLLFDNFVAQHGRQPWVGEQEDRVVLACLWDAEELPGAYGEQSWAKTTRLAPDEA